MRNASIIGAVIGLLVAAATTVRADVLVTPSIAYTGTVVRSGSDGITIKVGENELTVRLVDILQADVAKPAAFDQGLAAMHAGKYADALAALTPVVGTYAGLPLPWAEESMLHLGEAQVATKDYTAAKQTFDTFRLFYPKSQRLHVLDVKYARILIEQKQFEKALKLIEGVLDPLQQLDHLSEEQESGMAEGLVLMADCQVATGKTDDALDNYLKVVTLYDVDPDRTAEAMYKAGKILEQKGNWRRAKQIYDNVLKEAPEITFADEAKQRLADLTKAHPE